MREPAVLRLGEVASDRRVDRNARADGGRDDDLLQVATLRWRRLGPRDRLCRYGDPPTVPKLGGSAVTNR